MTTAPVASVRDFAGLSSPELRRAAIEIRELAKTERHIAATHAADAAKADGIAAEYEAAADRADGITATDPSPSQPRLLAILAIEAELVRRRLHLVQALRCPDGWVVLAARHGDGTMYVTWRTYDTGAPGFSAGNYFRPDDLRGALLDAEKRTVAGGGVLT